MGILQLITLPIGNLSDLTPRVLKALQEGTYYAVEDTRTFKLLLSQLGISLDQKKIYSFYDHSSPEVMEVLLQILRREQKLVLASEAGDPLISDPAFPLVSKALEEGHELQVLPGVSSVLVALDISGLPPYPFHFYGFYPREKEKGQQLLERVARIEGTHLFFEAPTRVSETLEQMTKQFPERPFCVARELTKKFEVAHRFKGQEWPQVMKEVKYKGEFVVLFHISKKDAGRGMGRTLLRELAEELLQDGVTMKGLSKLLGEILDHSSKDIYNQLNKINRE